MDEAEACKNIINRCQIILDKKIIGDAEVLRLITNFGFKIIAFDPLVVEYDSMPSEKQVCDLVDSLKKYLANKQKSKTENFTTRTEKFHLPTEQNIEAITSLPSSDLNDEAHYSKSKNQLAESESSLSTQHDTDDDKVKQEGQDFSWQFDHENVKIVELEKNKPIGDTIIDDASDISSLSEDEEQFKADIKDNHPEFAHEGIQSLLLKRGNKDNSDRNDWNTHLWDENGVEKSDPNTRKDYIPKDENLGISSKQHRSVQGTSYFESGDHETESDEDEATHIALKKEVFKAAKFYFQGTEYSQLFEKHNISDTNYELEIITKNEKAKDFLVKIKDFKVVDIIVKENVDDILDCMEKNYRNVKTFHRNPTSLTLMGPSKEVQAARTKALSLIGNNDHETIWSAKPVDSQHFKDTVVDQSSEGKGQVKYGISSDIPQNERRDFSSSKEQDTAKESEPYVKKTQNHGNFTARSKTAVHTDTRSDQYQKQLAQPDEGHFSIDKTGTQYTNPTTPENALYVGSSGIRVYVYSADITKLKVECIVNASNCHLSHEKGVSSIIAAAAGKDLIEECEEFVKAGNVVALTDVFVSSGGNLHAKKVIHAVGPRWTDYEEDEKHKCLSDLRRVVLRCLIQASFMKMVSIALPSISSAIFKVPPKMCAECYLDAVNSYDRIASQLNLSSLQFIHFVDVKKEMVSTVAECFLDKKNQSQTPEIFKEDFAFVQKHLQRNREEKKAGFVESLFFSSRLFNTDMKKGVSNDTKYARNRGKDYLVGEVHFKISTRYAMDFNTDLVITVGEPFDQLSGIPNFEIKKSKIISETKKTDFLIYECKGKPTRFIGQIGITSVKEEKIESVLNNLYSVTSCYPNLVQSLVVTSKFLYPEKNLMFSTKQPDPKIVNILSRLVYDFVRNPAKDSLIKNVILATSEETLPTIIYLIDRLEMGSKTSSGALLPLQIGSSVDDVASCSICKKSAINMQTTFWCKNKFCNDCAGKHKNCPLCNPIKNQPDGNMNVKYRPDLHLPGYESVGTYEIEYIFERGVQKDFHPYPGKPYEGCRRVAYVPASQDGYNFLKLLRVAFLRGLTFTIVVTKDGAYVIKWNIYHKTNIYHGEYGYPDPYYLPSTALKLNSKGVNLQSLTKEEEDDLARLQQFLFKKS